MSLLLLGFPLGNIDEDAKTRKTKQKHAVTLLCYEEIWKNKTKKLSFQQRKFKLERNCLISELWSHTSHD